MYYTKLNQVAVIFTQLCIQGNNQFIKIQSPDVIDLIEAQT